MITCPGCGGQNPPDTKVCEWCGRSFVAQPRRLPPPILAFGAVAILAIVVAVAAAVALVSLVATFSVQSGAEPTPAPLRELPGPTVEPSSETPAPATEGTPSGPEFVRIANTGNAGAYVRAEPRPAATGLRAFNEGTVLRVIGPDTVTDGRTWRNVEHPSGTRGWTPSEFLVSSEVGF